MRLVPKLYMILKLKNMMTDFKIILKSDMFFSMTMFALGVGIVLFELFA